MSPSTPYRCSCCYEATLAGPVGWGTVVQIHSMRVADWYKDVNRAKTKFKLLFSLSSPSSPFHSRGFGVYYWNSKHHSQPLFNIPLAFYYFFVLLVVRLEQRIRQLRFEVATTRQ